MKREHDAVPDEHEGRPGEPREEEAAHPAPGIEHEPEPDAENLIPVKHEPGTF